MVVTEAKADRAKTKLYFPEAKGYRCCRVEAARA